jgi:hypothetical protein
MQPVLHRDIARSKMAAGARRRRQSMKSVNGRLNSLRDDASFSLRTHTISLRHRQDRRRQRCCRRSRR